MEFPDFLSGILSFIFDMITALVSILVSPIDLMLNALVPQATTAIQSFFQWVTTMIGNFLDFINFMFYVLGIQPATWNLIMTVCSALLLVWVFLFPTRLIISVFRGMKE